MPSATVTNRGQITIPAAIRKRFALTPGSRVSFWEDSQGALHLTPDATSLDDLFGALHQPGQKAMTLEEMDLAIATAATRSTDQDHTGGR